MYNWLNSEVLFKLHALIQEGVKYEQLQGYVFWGFLLLVLIDCFPYLPPESRTGSGLNMIFITCDWVLHLGIMPRNGEMYCHTANLEMQGKFWPGFYTFLALLRRQLVEILLFLLLFWVHICFDEEVNFEEQYF